MDDTEEGREPVAARAAQIGCPQLERLTLAQVQLAAGGCSWAVTVAVEIEGCNRSDGSPKGFCLGRRPGALVPVAIKCTEINEISPLQYRRYKSTSLVCSY